MQFAGSTWNLSITLVNVAKLSHVLCIPYMVSIVWCNDCGTKMGCEFWIKICTVHFICHKSLLFNYLNKAIESELVPIHDNAKTLNKNASKCHKAQTWMAGYRDIVTISPDVDLSSLCFHNSIYPYRSPGICFLYIYDFWPGVYMSPFCIFIGICFYFRVLNPYVYSGPAIYKIPAFIRINMVQLFNKVSIKQFWLTSDNGSKIIYAVLVILWYPLLISTPMPTLPWWIVTFLYLIIIILEMI